MSLRQRVSIETIDGKILTKSDYNEDFVDYARMLGGTWEKGRWVFDKRDEYSVLNALYECYGDDGFRLNQCDVKVTFTEEYGVCKGPINVLGYNVARAFGRDTGATLQKSVRLLDGEFKSGGSTKYWCTMATKGTVVFMRDVSAVSARKFKSADGIIVEVIESYEKSFLMKQRSALLERVKEIDLLLGSL